MKMSKLAAAFLCTAVLAQEPQGYAHWTAAQLEAAGKKMAGALSPQKWAFEQFQSFGNHSVMMAHRQASGEAELHERQVDIFLVQSGSGTLAIGGQIVGAKTTGAGEIRGQSVKGGITRPLGTGDIVHIPANTPHQVLVEPGKSITYVIVKVDSK